VEREGNWRKVYLSGVDTTRRDVKVGRVDDHCIDLKSGFPFFNAIHDMVNELGRSCGLVTVKKHDYGP
jgi:hypothetical protein